MQPFIHQANSGKIQDQGTQLPGIAAVYQQHGKAEFQPEHPVGSQRHPVQELQICRAAGNDPVFAHGQRISARPAERETQAQDGAPRLHSTLKNHGDFRAVPEGTSTHIPMMFGYKCGMRLGEAFAVTWEDVLFERNQVKVTKQIQYSHYR